MTTLSTAARNAACNATVDLIDVGTTNPTGQLVYRTAGDVEVATLTFSNPAYGDAVAGVATANAITSDTSATGGVITKATAEDRDGNIIFTLTVTDVGGGGDIEIAGGTTIGAGATVSCDSLTHTQPA